MCHFNAHIILQKILTGKFSDQETEAQITLMVHEVCLAHGWIKEKGKGKVRVGPRSVEV